MNGKALRGSGGNGDKIRHQIQGQRQVRADCHSGRFSAGAWVTLGVAAMYNAVNVLLLRYLVDFVGIGAAVAGSLMAVSKLYDAFTDPVIGSISDRSKSKMGRRRPSFFMGVYCSQFQRSACSMFLQGLTPQMAIFYAGGALILYATAYGSSVCLIWLCLPK